MHAKELQRYKQLLVERRQELLTGSTGSVIPAAGRVEGEALFCASDIRRVRVDGLARVCSADFVLRRHSGLS